MTAHVAHVAGARPNFPKAAPVLRALHDLGVEQQLIHTGQHYDQQMSDVFFSQLAIGEPDICLNVGSGSHGEQTGAVMVGLERLFAKSRPALLIVYGDINSTLAAALVAAKAQIPLAHVEAGMRSFDPEMPEEINRIVTDRLSDLLFATSPEAIAHLGREGVEASKIHFVGNPMIDTLLANLDRFDVSAARARHRLFGPYVVGTFHRPVNVDAAARAAELVAAVHAVADDVQVVLPLHPRGRSTLAQAGLFAHRGVTVLEPLGYVEFISLVRGAAAVVTDSGGVQEETTVLGVPCFTMRKSTERPVTITHGTNRLVTAAEVPTAVRQQLSRPRTDVWPTPPLWDGAAGPRIAAVIVERFAALQTKTGRTGLAWSTHASS